MLILKGNYIVKLAFGGEDVAIDTQNIKEFTIVSDMNKMLPEFRIQLHDAGGILTHLVPFDKGMSTITIQISDSLKNTLYTAYNFTVYRRQPEGIFGASSVYDIRGLLEINGLFAPSHSRGFTGTVTSTLTQVAEEMGVDETDISPSLNYVKTIIQPNWSNMTFLNYLSRNLSGKSSEGGYNIFIRVRDGKSSFVCRTHQELAKNPIRINMAVNDNPVEDHFPVMDYFIMDNYKLFGVFGAKKQYYSYFDYNNSEFKEEELDATDFFSLSDYFLIDGDDTEVSGVLENGTNNEFTTDFVGRMKASYYRRLNSLSKIWVLTWGQPNICQGDIAKLLFMQGKASGNLQAFQYSGYWMIERVVQSFTDTFRTRLLLTRCGVDTDKGCTLVSATKKRR